MTKFNAGKIRFRLQHSLVTSTEFMLHFNLFSFTAGRTHNEHYVLWREGELASPGLKQLSGKQIIQFPVNVWFQFSGFCPFKKVW